MRLLEFLLENSLAPDDRTARGLIMRGDVLVDDRSVTSPEAPINETQHVRVRGAVGQAVSRGAEKLSPALSESGFDPQGQVCLDLGVSTGGFTQVLLAHGASRVYAVDVGYGVVAQAVRTDPRVVLLERTNARELTCALVPEQVSRVVGDLSFISWRAVLPAVVPLLSEHAELLLLVKPQFELAALGRDDLIPGGVVREEAALAISLTGLYNTWQDAGFGLQGLFPAGISGAKGNREYFVWLNKGMELLAVSEYEAKIAQVIAKDNR